MFRSGRAYTRRVNRLESLLHTFMESAARRPRLTLALLFTVTLLLGLGLFRLEFRTNLIDWLPADQPNVRAFEGVIDHINGVTNQELVWLELEPAKAAAAGVSQITDEAAIRAQAEFASFVRARVPEVRSVFGLPQWLALANYVSSDEDATGNIAALKLPEDAATFRVFWSALWNTQRDLLEATISNDGAATLLGFTVEGEPLSNASRDLGVKLVAAVDAYKAWDGKRHDLFREDLMTPLGLASGLARVDRTLSQESLLLVPLAGLFVVILLWFAFRSLQTVGVAVACLILGLVWTYGLMGLTGVGLNIVTVALVPLLLGSGIDYAIHLLNAYRAGESGDASSGVTSNMTASSMTASDMTVSDMTVSGVAVSRAASRTGAALVLTSLITVGGLLSLLVSGIPGMVQLGFFAAFGLAASTLLVLTLPPAFYALRKQTKTVPYRPSALMRRLMLGVARFRVPVALFIIGLTLAALLMQGRTVYQLDVIQGNFPPSDPVAKAVARAGERLGGAFPEFVILEGDATDPALLDYTRALEAELQETLGEGTEVVSLNRILGSYEVLKDGVGPAVRRFFLAGGDLSRAAPSTREDIRSALTTMHSSPAWSPLVSVLSSPDLNLSVLIVRPPESAGSTLSSTSSTASLEAAGRLYGELEQAVEATRAAQPDGVTTHFLGYRTITYLFIQTSLFWMRVLFAASLLWACTLLFLFTRSLRAVLTVAVVMVVTGVWWLGLLPLFGIYISVFLIFPVVFIVSIGSDYAVHLVLGVLGAEERGAGEVYARTGKAVLFSVLTTSSVFFLFATMYLVSVTQVMLSVGLAVVATFLGTVLVVPLVMRR